MLSLLILGTAGAGYLYYRHLDDNLRSSERSSGKSGVTRSEPNAAGKTPLNILLLGSDSRNSDENIALGGSRENRGTPPRADVQMLLHVSADRKNASITSIPRDTRVDIPECKDPASGKTYKPTTMIINESLARGGPGCTLVTWEKLTGVYIDHWMMVDFAGLVRMADAVEGVPVCVEDNVWDRPTAAVSGGSGLKLKKGTTEIKGEQALQWLRTRHAFYNDQGRAKARHMYISALIRKLKEQNAFTDTGRIMDLAEEGTKALQVSDELGSVMRLFDLAMELRDVPLDRITMTTLPTQEYIGNRNHLVPVDSDAERLFTLLREDVAFDSHGEPSDRDKRAEESADTSAPKTSPRPEPTPSGPAAAEPDTIGISVVNGTGGENGQLVKGRAGAVAEALRAEGFTAATASDQVAPSEKTALVYRAGGGAEERADALSVAKALGLPTGAVRAGDVPVLTLTVGADWTEGSAFPKAEKPKAGDLPKDADAFNAKDSGCMPVYEPYRW
ncbi:LCP family protein [Streptomyces sp. NPDC046887]|uniref:LCP family protein n=1 Tax=Streptomyces sp. NPDC046887 TaxID=3155472 RepID=UPI0033E6DEBF